MDIEKCHDCGVKPGEIHKAGCDWKVCSLCGGQILTCHCNPEESQRIPFGTVREIAVRIPYFSSEHIEKYVKHELSEAIEKGL